MNEAPIRYCLGCGCNEFNACITSEGLGCAWSETYPALCTCCSGEAGRERGPRHVGVNEFERLGKRADPLEGSLSPECASIEPRRFNRSIKRASGGY